MFKLRGRGLINGVAMGTAAVVRTRNARPIPPSIPPRVVAQLTRRREDETPDIVLVAEDYTIAEAFVGSVKWGNVVGIVAGPLPEEAETASSLPAVVGVPDLLDSIKDDMLLIVDAGRGLVFGDPDGMMVAQYQAERNRLAPKRRLYLGTAHLPAQTLDGRTIQVYARVTTPEDIETAIDVGADALFLPADNSLLPDLSDPSLLSDTSFFSDTVEPDAHPMTSPEFDSEATEATLKELNGFSSDTAIVSEPPAATSTRASIAAMRDLVGLAASKPLLLDNGYALPLTDLLLAAVQADITVAGPLMPHLEGQGIGELGQELNEVRADLLANDTLCEMPRLAVEIPPAHPIPFDDPEQSAFFMDRLAYNGASRLFLALDNDRIDPGMIAWLSDLTAAANTATLPVIVHWIVWFFNFGASDAEEDTLSEDAIITLQWLIGAGSGGIVVTPADIKKVKQAIRTLSYAECRDNMPGPA